MRKPWRESTKTHEVVKLDPIEVCESYGIVSSSNKQLVYELMKTAYVLGVKSISAPLVGVNKRLLVFYSEVRGNWVTMYDPVILHSSNQVARRWEKCCVYPDVNQEKSRSSRITVSFKNIDGKIGTAQFVEFDAFLIQHEMDHLVGKSWRDLK